MGVLKVDDHEALRMWALENSFGDPESLIDRRDGKLLFRSARAAKQYRRLEKIHKDRRTQNAQERISAWTATFLKCGPKSAKLKFHDEL